MSYSETNRYGTIRHYNEARELHDPSKGVPAVRYADGTTYHYQNGKLHDPSKGVPAVRYADGTTEHYQNGELHDPLKGVPAVRYANGATEHYQNGKCQDPLKGVPAVRRANGTTEHYQNGVRYDPKYPILANDGHYVLQYIEGRYVAGCQNFTVGEAIKHWTDAKTKRGALFLAAIELHQRELTK